MWNGREPFSEQHTVTRDDLIRLVVGMQWREMGYLYVQVKDQDLLDDDGGIFVRLTDKSSAMFFAQYPTASAIVDEWLGAK